jgi:CRP-like cAMP-binding protein
MSNQAMDLHETGAPSESVASPECSELRWDILADCRHCAVRGQALFSALRGPDFEHIFLPIRSAVCPRDTILYQQDQTADAVYSIRRGMLKLIKNSSTEGDRIVRLLGRGASTGLEALTHGFYWHTAVALRQLEVCRIPLGVFAELQAHNIQLSDRMVGQWERQVVEADRWLTELGSGSLHERVKRLVRVLAEMDAAEGNLLELPPMADLANILGASRESVSRTLAELKRGKALRRVAPRTYDCDLDAIS